jgi:hypothetical protein
VVSICRRSGNATGMVDSTDRGLAGEDARARCKTGIDGAGCNAGSDAAGHRIRPGCCTASSSAFSRRGVGAEARRPYWYLRDGCGAEDDIAGKAGEVVRTPRLTD